MLLLQGMDTSGKDGTVKHVVGQVNPRRRADHVVQAADPRGARARLPLAHPRARCRRPGYIGVFDRRQYEDVLIVRVHDLVPPSGVGARYDRDQRAGRPAGRRRRHVSSRCFLHISNEEQRERLLARLRRPDASTGRSTRATSTSGRAGTTTRRRTQDALERCSTEVAPWYVVPADRKWYRNWAVTQLLLETLRELDPQYPERPDLDLPALKKQLAGS